MQPQPSDKAPPPLSRVRVLDLSRVLAGPWCTQILADLGAEVIKVEQPGSGDDTRHWGPPWAGEDAAYFLCANRNKKSVCLDLASAFGQAAVRKIACQSDVLVENFKAGTMERFGLDYASLTRLNPRLVYCSISGYGRDSPLAGRPGYDYVIQAEGGLMSVTGEPGGEPMKAGVAVADLFTGMAAAQAILAAIIAQRRDGLGQHIDMALFDAQLSMLANVASAYLVSGREPGRYGNAHPAIVPYQTFATSDGEIVLAVGNDQQFRQLCRRVLARPDLAEDARYLRSGDRAENRETLVPELAREFGRAGSATWLERLHAAGIPCGEVRTVGQALSSPEALVRGMVKSVPNPAASEIKLVGSPLKLGRTPVVEPSPPPRLGEHTDEVLAAFGVIPESDGKADTAKP